MPDSAATRRALPLILVRGFGGVGVEDERRIAYQGFNDGTVYPQKRGENYIYEGLILRFMKSDWQYRDATNVVGYYPNAIDTTVDIPAPLQRFDKQYFSGDRIVIDPAMALNLLKSAGDPRRSLWVFRYYDLNDRRFDTYGKALVRLISFIRDLASEGTPNEPPPKVNILAHSMGGLLVREAIQVTYPALKRQAGDFINKIVTLGTPHQGISFQVLREWIKILRIDVYVGERDVYGVGFSDNVIFRKQYYLRAVLDNPLTLFRHTGEQFMQKEKDRGKYTPIAEDVMEDTDEGWAFSIGGTGFTARLGLELDYIPEDGVGIPLREQLAATGRSGVIGHSAMPKPSSETAVPGA